MRAALKRKRSSAFRPSPSTPRSNASRSRPAASRPSSRRTTLRQTSSSGRAQLPTSYPTDALPEVINSDEFTDDELGHVIAAVDMKDTDTVGCAYYSAEEETLYLLSDSQSGGMDVIDSCKLILLSTIWSEINFKTIVILQIKPTVILAPSRVELNSQKDAQSLAQDHGMSPAVSKGSC